MAQNATELYSDEQDETSKPVEPLKQKTRGGSNRITSKNKKILD